MCWLRMDSFFAFLKYTGCVFGLHIYFNHRFLGSKESIYHHFLCFSPVEKIKTVEKTGKILNIQVYLAIHLIDWSIKNYPVCQLWLSHSRSTIRNSESYMISWKVIILIYKNILHVSLLNSPYLNNSIYKKKFCTIRKFGIFS